MSINEFICDCNIIHEDVVKDTLNNWLDESFQGTVYQVVFELKKYNMRCTNLKDAIKKVKRGISNDDVDSNNGGGNEGMM